MSTDNVNWYDFYKVLEHVEADVGGEKGITSAGWASASQLGRFTGTANSGTILGDAARHAVTGKPPLKNPMTLPEADSFIRGITRQWIESHLAGGNKGVTQPTETSRDPGAADQTDPA